MAHEGKTIDSAATRKSPKQQNKQDELQNLQDGIRRKHCMASLLSHSEVRKMKAVHIFASYLTQNEELDSTHN